MTLSEKAEKGKKTAVAVSVMCFVISVFSLISFNILMAAMGFAAAYHIGRGSLTARNFTVILRIADIPVLAVLAFIASEFTGDFLPQFVIATALIAVVDVIALLILIFNSNVSAFFNEVYESTMEN